MWVRGEAEFAANGDITHIKGVAQVFDRWGEKVFESDDVSEHWTGNAFGGSYYVPDGVYVFSVILKFPAEVEQRRYQGHITVIR